MIDAVRKWWRRREKRRTCFHHDHRRGPTSYITERIIDYRKLYRCGECGRVWII